MSCAQLELFPDVLVGTLWQIDQRPYNGKAPMIVRVVDHDWRDGWRTRYRIEHHPCPDNTPAVGRTGALALRLFQQMYPRPVTEHELATIHANGGRPA